MKFGIKEDQWEMIDQLLVQPVKKQGGRIWIFGSRARGDYRTFSDLDVLVNSDLPFPAGFLSKIKQDLEESRITIKVDLVEFEDLAETYKENILRDRILI